MNIGSLDKIISYMHLNLQLGVNFNVRVLSNWHDTNGKLHVEAKLLCETYAHVLESYILISTWRHFLPILLVVASSPTVLLIRSFTS